MLLPLLRLEVGVLEDVGGGADKAETHLLEAGVAVREAVGGQHDRIVRVACPPSWITS